jgi:Domain of unknown function (DUF4389)
MATPAAYPVRVEARLDPQLSRWLWLVKWLLAIPHYLIVGLFIGGGWFAWSSDQGQWSTGGGLITLLVLIAAIALAVTGRYPTSLFDLVLGLNRWVLRVAAYVGLMTDAYPPFRLDLGGGEPSGTLTVPPPPSGPAVQTTPQRAGAPPAGGWTGGKVVALVVGVLLALTSAVLLSGGATALWADRTQRDAAGYLSTDARGFATTTYALATDRIDLRVEGPDWLYAPATLDTARVRVTSADPATPLFVGIARTQDAARYLAGIHHDTITNLAGVLGYRAHPGGAPELAPTQQGFWTVQSSGTGTRTLVWPVGEGTWTVVVMNADGSRGVDVRADVGAKVPALEWIAAGLLASSLVLLGGAVALLLFAVRRPTAPATP